MPQTIPISRIEISFFVHATEDLHKVIEAVQSLLPTHHLDEIVFERENLEGYRGNPIVFFKTKIREKPIIESFIDNLSTKLEASEKERLLSYIERHVDENGRLYIRLSKQAACFGKFEISNADPVHIQINFTVHPKRLEKIVEASRGLGILP